MLGFHTLGRQALGATTRETFAAATAPTYTANLVLSGTGFTVALGDTLSGTGHALNANTSAAGSGYATALGDTLTGTGFALDANTSAAGAGTALTLDTELTTQVD